MPTNEEEDHADLAALLADQFAVLSDEGPSDPRAVIGGEVLVFDFGWPTIPAEEFLIESGRLESMTRFRAEFLKIAVPSMVELVEIELRREVVDSTIALGDDPRRVAISFALGGPLEQDRTDVEALRNWGEQVRRNAREKRALYRRRREELARLRLEIAEGPGGANRRDRPPR